MQLTVKEIADNLGGIVEGNEKILITHPDKIEDANKGAITFLANPKYTTHIYTTKASAVLVDTNFIATQPLTPTLIRVDNVYSAITQFLQFYEQSFKPVEGISSLAFVHKTAQIGDQTSIAEFTSINASAKIGKSCHIYSQVHIGVDAKIGDNVTIYPGVKIYHDCEIGDNVIIHANAVIGSDGFGFAPQADGTYQKMPQVGKVIIEADVEIGANTVIDRATMGATIVKKGTKLDNLIQVAHNVTIGENTVIAAQAGISGSTKIGDQCQIGGQVGFVGHISIADGVKVQAQSGVTKTIKKEGTKIYGYPAIGYQDYLRAYALFRQLPKLEARIRQLEQNQK
ncbi:MAG: UDP-3-O-(3-hydroxymyristoyl)glucosamine N-acyltransferase [Bacteroidota bacterium]